MYAGRAHLHLGDLPRAIEIFGGIVASLTGPLMHDHLGVPVLPSVFARSHLVEALAEAGRFDESRRYADEAVELAETTNHPDTLFWAHRAAGLRHLAQGDASSAAVALERAHEICRTFDMAASLTRIMAELGLAWALDGRITEALPMLERAADDATRLKQAMTYPKVLLLLRSTMDAGMLRESAETAARALEQFRHHNERGHEASTFDCSPRSRRSRTHPTSPWLRRGIGWRSGWPRSWRCDRSPRAASSDLGRLLRATGDRVRAIERLRGACAQFRAMGMAESLSEAEAELRALA